MKQISLAFIMFSYSFTSLRSARLTQISWLCFAKHVASSEGAECPLVDRLCKVNTPNMVEDRFSHLYFTF